MAQNKEIIVQSFITAFCEQKMIIEAARIQMNIYKTKYQALNPDLTDTALTAQNVTDATQYITDLNTLADLAIVATLEGKLCDSHDTKGLD